MLRAATWAVGLFGLAMLVRQAFPIPWLEPFILLALGVAMLWVSARSGLKPRREKQAAGYGLQPTAGANVESRA